MTLRCTKKLLNRVPSSSTSSGVRPTNALGDWYADILFTEAAWVVICVSERSLVSVVIPARGLSSLVPRFRVAVGDLLLRLGVSNEQVRAEREEMVEIVVGPTASRSVLGSMNDLCSSVAVDSRKVASRIWNLSRLNWRKCPADLLAIS